MELNKKEKAMIVLASTTGVGTRKANKILELVGGAEYLSENIIKNKTDITKLISEKDYQQLCFNLENLNFKKLEQTLEEKNIIVLTRDDDRYPDALKHYDDSPLCLYCIGNIRLLNTPSFAVVGSRFPTNYGIRVTEKFVSKLSDRFCIVSGMALGVDAYAHKVALDCGGRTIAVLGSGIDVIYPQENKDLYKRIIEEGLVISQYMPGVKAMPYNFPIRNKIISELACSVLITEAGENSGTRLTRNYAIEQGKEVFCVPGNIFSKSSAGCNRAIMDCQTRMVLDVNDIYYELGLPKTKEINEVKKIQLDENENKIVNILTRKGELHFEEILSCVDIGVSQLTSLLTKMTALGLITKTKHNYWSI